MTEDLGTSECTLEDITLTKQAAAALIAIAENCGAPYEFRLAVKGGGCSGLEYYIDFKGDREFEGDKLYDFTEYGLGLYIDSMSLMYLEGVTVDYESNFMQSGFVFRNPNAKGTCGCGSSFTVG